MTDGISSRTVEVQCGDLEGPALDWAVAKAEGRCLHERTRIVIQNLYFDRICEDCGKDIFSEISGRNWRPSTEWSQGGPLIQEHGLSLIAPEEGLKDSHWCVVKEWCHGVIESTYPESPTALIAACRAIVAAHLGEVVSVPAELVENK